MRLTDKQIDLLGKQVLIQTKSGDAIAKIRILMDTTPILFLRENVSQQMWCFDSEKLIVAPEVVSEIKPEKPKFDFLYRDELIVFKA